MIRKLRIKLVVAAMLSLLAVLAAILGIAGALNYRTIVRDAEQKLQILADNGGRFPEDMRGKGFREFSPDMPFESRYFIVTTSEDNTVQSVNTGRIASINEEQAEKYAKTVIGSGKTAGFLDTYRYMVYTNADGTKQICFLACHRELESFHNFLIYSILVSIVGSVAVLILLIIASQRIVKPVADSYEKQKRFITDAGHELKTPLTIISADTEVLEMDFGESEWLDDIRSQTERLAELTNNLVFLARMEEQPQMEKVEFSLSEAAEEAAEDFLGVARMQGKTLEASVEPDLRMFGDQKTIRRLMAIFLDNAVKYADENGRIQLTLDKQRSQLRLQIYNTTEHISRESLEHLFDRFYRTDQSRNSQTGGYGLGLSIAAAIVAAHNGKISATTDDENSLRITVTFPV
ncbi:MAG: HAMP domain-containing sensor histidine kinase [Eubacteriales bacterium]|nr:HAMP domain-containing sensor histidine kinase [Eubacteriales bacterium]